MGEDISVLAAIAGTRGLFNAAQAAVAGVTPDRLATLIGRRLAKGWYTTGPIESQEHRHLLTARALVGTFAGRAVASHHTAVLWHGLPMYLWNAATIHLIRTRDDRARRRRGLVVHPAPAHWAQPTDVVPPAVAIVQYGHLHGRMSAVVAGDALLHNGLGTMTDVADAVELFERCPGNAASRPMLELLDARSESPGESRLRVTLKMLGYAVTPQVKFPQVGARVDFLLDAARVIVEFDGRGKYKTPADVFRREATGGPAARTRLRGRAFRLVRSGRPAADSRTDGAGDPPRGISAGLALNRPTRTPGYQLRPKSRPVMERGRSW